MLGSESLENMTSVPNSSYVFTFIDFNSGDNLFDAGLEAYAGVSYFLPSENNTEIYLKARYQHSLTSLSKGQKDNVDTYIDALSVDIGVRVGV